jgi:signal transduction histidine kinase
VRPVQRLRKSLLAFTGVSALLLLALLILHDQGMLRQTEDLFQRLGAADQERLESQTSEKLGDILRPLAVLVDGRRDELVEGMHTLAEQPSLIAWAATVARPGKGHKAVSPAMVDPKLALNMAAASSAGGWTHLWLLNPAGKTVAVWPAALPLEDFSADPLIRAVAAPGQAPGFALHTYVKPAPAPKGAPLGAAQLRAACGLEGPDGNVSGQVVGQTDVRAAFLAGDTLELESFLKSNPGSAAMLVRGNGQEVWHSSKEAFSENLSAISADYRSVLDAMMKDASGSRDLASYDGQPSLLTWLRVGNAPEGAAAEDVLSLAVVVPLQGLSAAALPHPAKGLLKQILLLAALVLLGLGVPMGAALVLAPQVLDPYRATAAQARRVEEFSPVPDLALPEEADTEAQAINRALAVLARRTQQGEDRVRELDAALRRVEDQAGRDATASAQELSSLREKFGTATAGRQAAEAKFEAAQKTRQEAESQLVNLRSALETATRNTELKAAENRNLSVQVQDLMRAMEEQRKVAEKAQENLTRKDSEVVRLAAVNTLSSELKATLSVIKNYISTMLGSQGTISDAQQEFLGVVINKSARLERLIGDLVELSELGSGSKPLKLESTSPSALVQEALVNARPQAEHKKISLELAEGGNLSPVMVDREKMGAVLRSLLSQAIKVTSRSERIGLLLSERESTVELRVTDPGMSLPPDRAAKVFNQFHGVDSQAGPEFIGTGLRFPILKSVVEAHGGKIWIESQVGRGKTLVVAMPKAGVAAGPSMVPGPPAIQLPTAPAQGGAPLAPPALTGMPKVAPLGPPPLPKAGPAVAPLGPAPAAPPLAPASAGPPKSQPVIHKPAPLDDSLNTPWKRKETKGDELEETMELPPVLPKAVVPSLPSPPPVSSPVGTGTLSLGLGLLPLTAPGAIPAAPPSLRTNAKPSEADTADFDKVFGGLPAQAEEQKGGLPKVELKTGAKPNNEDLAQFASVFGGKTAPPGMGAPPPPPPGAAPSTADFDALFGAPAAPPATAKAAPAGLGTPPPPPPAANAADFDAIFGSSGPASASGPSRASAAVPPKAPPPPAAMAGMADLDAIFGSSAAPAKGPGSGPPPPPAPGSSGLNNMDDLNRMLGN